jgi:DNA-binding NtrC family response regulator/class 3 adenylate cyclase/tetratricopeptide (TPR) repeat protein
MADASLPPPGGHPTDRLMGTSSVMAALRAQIRHLAPFDTLGHPHVPTVLLQGETGTGKGLVARVLHDSGPRAAGPFIDVNCAAIPDSMLEAELFGYEAGAFTDAKRAKPGLFEAASGGTLFLDEVDALPLGLQGKLLTAMETKRVRRLGAVRDQAVDVKLIAATNTVLPEAVAAGRFRADLYHRLAVVVLALPPLRERREDLLVLAQAFLRHVTAAHGVPPKHLSPAAEAWLQAYPWPGNVRELSHLMERVTLLHVGETVEAATLMQLCHPLTPPAAGGAAVWASQAPEAASPEPAEAEQIRHALVQTGGNVARAARLLGVSRDTVRYRMQRYGITRLRPTAPPVPETATLAPPAALPSPDVPAALPRQAVAAPIDRPRPAAERRYLTVLVCDLVDATRLMGHLDPEDWQEVVRAYHQTCAEVIHRFDGCVDQYAGDEVLACFGYPLAHEDDAQRAVRAGLALLDALDALTRRLALPAGQRLAVRLGVHTGVVVIDTAGAGGRPEPLALGETPAMAARLQQVAAPQTLVVSAATYRLIEGYFTCEALGAPSLRGLAPPLPVYRVLRPSGVQDRLEVAAARGLTPLVGRSEEVGLLAERWARVTAGMGQVVVLAGEAGIGKSRLVQELKDHLAREAHLCLECRGSPSSQHTAWAPIGELLHRWLQWRPGQAPDEPLGKLEAFLTPVPLARDEAVPLVAELMALPLPAERYPARPRSPEQRRQHTLDVLLALLGALAAQQPLLVIVEDLHWVDPSTLEWLTLLIDQVPTAPIFMVLTCRPEFQPPWGFRTHLTPLVLNRLTPAQVEAMVGGMRGGARLSAAVRAQIVAQTDGIPLFVEEVTKAVLEAGSGTDIPAQDMATGRAPALAIPATLHEALMARLDRLGSAKGVAQLGAILGRQFAYPLLRAVAPLEEEPLQRDLATLVAAELLYQRGQPPQAVYTFKHALIQEAAYESVLQRVRRHTHQRILQVLEAQFPEMVATQPELLAHHALRGEHWDQAVTYFRHAGEQALAHSAYREAVAAFERALGALQHLPESRDTLAQAIDVRLALRHALYPLGELGQILVSLQDARARAEALGDRHRLGWVETSLLAHFAQACELGQALAAGQRALAIAADLGDVGLTVTVQGYLGNVYLSIGDYRRAEEFYRNNVACLHGELLQERFGLHGLPSVFSRSALTCSLAECGAFAEGRAPAEEGVQLAEAADHPYSRVRAYYAMGFRALRQGDLPQAISILERTLDLAQGAHIRLLVPWVAASLGAAYTLAGRTIEAVPLLEQAVAQAMAIRFLFDHALRVVWLGEAYLRAGRLDEASTQAQQALAFSQAHQERGHEAYAQRLLGEVAARREPPEAEPAAAYYRQALVLAEELGMRPLQAHCHLGLGTLYLQMGRSEEAHAALSTAVSLYRAMEMTFWLPQAEAMLAEVEG